MWYNKKADAFKVIFIKNQSSICINYEKVRDDYSNATITLSSNIDGVDGKYKSINYGELYELSKIMEISDLTEEKIKKTCEDERDCFDSGSADYSLTDGKRMSKISRIGFNENPVVTYELSNNYVETVEIAWNL